MIVNELGKDYQGSAIQDDDEPNTDIDFYVDKVRIFDKWDKSLSYLSYSSFLKFSQSLN